MEFYQMLPVLLVAACTLAIGAALFWPGRGWLAGWRGRRQQVRAEDSLKYLHAAELRNSPPTLSGLAATLWISLPSAAEILSSLERLGLVEWKASALQLTPAGGGRERLEVRGMGNLLQPAAADCGDTGLPGSTGLPPRPLLRLRPGRRSDVLFSAERDDSGEPGQ